MLAHEVGAAAILAPTVSGSTAKTLSRFRPPMPIVAVTPSPIVLRQLALYWGVYPVLGRRKKTTDEVVDAAVRRALLAGYVDQGDIVLVTGGVVGSTPGSTNLVTIRRIPRVLATGRGLGTQRVRGHPVRLRPGEPWQDKRLTLDDILIVDELDPNLGELLQHVGGLITSESGIESYAALAAVELGLPALVSAHGDLDALAEHKLIVLDASTGVVYDEQL
ncbi:MAG: hypothetical protein D6790_18520 [Caldilineae bacterium]|nr:MAG: hypothetical protein D6790_18520 [Caldilineae bacterium]